MDEISIGYVILHYNTYDDTVTCVDSIRRNSDSPIVIVCNGSRNDSDERIESAYREEKNIYVVQSKENIGFARGNNLGIDYIRDNKLSEIVVCLNNDIVVISENYERKIKEEYTSYRFGVGGGGCS